MCLGFSRKFCISSLVICSIMVIGLLIMQLTKNKTHTIIFISISCSCIIMACCILKCCSEYDDIINNEVENNNVMYDVVTL